jgi:hypothetical protein
MAHLSANRTLVKSPPELWSELSEVESLARHLGEFGEITISHLHPEHTVAWEGEHARGTVELEAAGWGTKVTLSAALPEPDGEVPETPEPVAQEPAEDAGEPAEPEPAPAPKRESWLRRWLFRQRGPAPAPVAAEPEAESAPEPLAWYDPDPGVTPEPVPAPWDREPEPEPDAPAPDPEAALAVLEATLDALGAAHHRPFSRQG